MSHELLAKMNACQYSPNGLKLWDAFRLYASNNAGRYACLTLSHGPIAPFFECFAVCDDFGNLIPIGAV